MIGSDVATSRISLMTTRPEVPPGFELVRTTATFDNRTVPAGLLAVHRVADGVWGRLVVRSGRVTFVFDDDPDHPIGVDEGQAVAIPPGRAHHLELAEPATFAVEFYRASPSNQPRR
jgi:tellurite resistance-related uncharacterized protein